MTLERKFIRNFLSKGTSSKGKYSVFVILSLCLFASGHYWNDTHNISSFLTASYSSVVTKGEYWRLFTTSFVHADLKHLLSNSLMLSFLIYYVTSFYGSFISLFLSFAMATITNFIVLEFYGGSTTLVGASGVVYYLWGFWMILYMFLQTQLSLISRSLRVGSVFLILLVPTEYQPNTSYLAHYIGFALGMVIGLIYYLLNHSRLHQAEQWSVKEISDELTELDVIALNYPETHKED